MRSSCVNVRAGHLHELFKAELKKYEFDKQHLTKLEARISLLLEQRMQSSLDELKTQRIQKSKTEKLLESIEEKFIAGDIDKELYEKYSSKYKETLKEIASKTENSVNSSSNFKKAISKGLEIASNLSQLWISPDYNNKQLHQFLLLTDGLL